MAAFLVTSISGFFVVFLLAFTAALPYLLRHRGRKGMGLHYCIGYLIFLVLLLHMFVSMQGGMARGTSLAGLNLASLALVFVMLQVMMGTTLVRGSAVLHPLRHTHFAMMLIIMALAALHIALNSTLVHGLLQG